MGLHHRVRLVGRRVGRLHRDRRGREGLLEIAHPRLGWRDAARRRHRCRAVLGGEVEASVRADVVDLDQRGRRARLLEALGDDHGDGLVVVLDLGRGQEALDVELAPAEGSGVLVRDDRHNAGSGLCRREVHGRDPALGDAGADHDAVREDRIGSCQS